MRSFSSGIMAQSLASDLRHPLDSRPNKLRKPHPNNSDSLPLTITSRSPSTSRKLLKPRPSSIQPSLPPIFTALSDEDIRMARLQTPYPPSSYRSPDDTCAQFQSLDTHLPSSSKTALLSVPSSLAARSYLESNPPLSQIPKKRSIRLSFRRKKRHESGGDLPPRPPLPVDGDWLPPLSLGTPITQVLPGSQSQNTWPDQPTSAASPTQVAVASSHWTSGLLRDIGTTDGYKATWSLDFELDVDWDPDLEVWETNVNLAAPPPEDYPHLHPFSEASIPARHKFTLEDEDVPCIASPVESDWHDTSSSHSHASHTPCNSDELYYAASPLTPPIASRDALVGSIMRSHSAPGGPPTHRRWTLAMALMDDAITDEALVRELERVRMQQILSAMNHRTTIDTLPQQSTPRRKIISTASLPPLPSSFSDPLTSRHERPPPPPPPQSSSELPDIIQEATISPSFASLSPRWLSARRALLIVRELVRTERSYLLSLRALLLGRVSGAEPPGLMLAYIATLARVSEALLGQMESDLCVKGVANAFVRMCEAGLDRNVNEDATANGGLEAAFVAWSGVVGGWFVSGATTGKSNNGGDTQKKRGRLSKPRISILETREKENKKPLRINPSPHTPTSPATLGVAAHSPLSPSSPTGPTLSRTASSLQVHAGGISPLKRTMSTWRKSMPSIPVLGITRTMSLYGASKPRTSRRPATVAQGDIEDNEVFVDAHESPEEGAAERDAAVRAVWSSDDHAKGSSNLANVSAWGGAQVTLNAPQEANMGVAESRPGVFAEGNGGTGAKLRQLPTVRDLAILPTQRIMRYVLLYRDLLAHTPTTSPSRVLVERAVEVAARVAQKCDRAQDNAAFFLRR